MRRALNETRRRRQRRHTHTLRLLLLRGMRRLVHAEAARLQLSMGLPAQQALGECVSQRLLRECSFHSQLVAVLDAEREALQVSDAAQQEARVTEAAHDGTADESLRDYDQLLLAALEVLPVLSWGSPHSLPGFFTAGISEAQLLKLLQRTGAPPTRRLIAGVFNWFACSPAQLSHAAVATEPLSDDRLSTPALPTDAPGPAPAPAAVRGVASRRSLRGMSHIRPQCKWQMWSVCCSRCSPNARKTFRSMCSAGWVRCSAARSSTGRSAPRSGCCAECSRCLRCHVSRTRVGVRCYMR